MPVSGIVVVTIPGKEEEVMKKLSGFNQIEIKGQGLKGIAVIIEGNTIEEIREVSEKIEKFEDVLEVQLIYLNFEDVINKI